MNTKSQYNMITLLKEMSPYTIKFLTTLILKKKKKCRRSRLDFLAQLLQIATKNVSNKVTGQSLSLTKLVNTFRKINAKVVIE